MGLGAAVVLVAAGRTGVARAAGGAGTGEAEAAAPAPAPERVTPASPKAPAPKAPARLAHVVAVVAGRVILDAGTDAGLRRRRPGAHPRGAPGLAPGPRQRWPTQGPEW